MFGTIRKHSNWLWAIIITVIIVSFVIFFTPSVGNQGGPGGRGLVVDGRNFSQDQINAASREVGLGTMLGFSQQSQSNEEHNQQVLQHLLLLAKLDQYGIAVGPEAAAEWIRRNIVREGGPFSGMTFEQVAEQFFKPKGFTANELAEFARHQAGIELLISSIAAPAALITPKEIETAYRRDNEKLVVDVAYVSNSNYLARVTLDPNELTKFYSNRVAAYRSPDRVQVNYVRFATSNFVAQAETDLSANSNLDAAITQAYTQRGTNYYEGLTETEAKARIKQEMIDQQAFKLAQRKAYDFINEYYDGEARTAQAMGAAAKAQGLEMVLTEPFTRETPPSSIVAGPEFVDSAFKLTDADPFSSGVSAADGYYALAFGAKLPGSIQPYEEVKERVQKEYRDDRARTMAREAADQFYLAATNAVTSGQSFTALAELSGFQVSSLTNLTMRTTSVPGVTLPVQPRQVYSAASNMETNGVSRPQFAADGLYLLHTGSRTPPTAEEISLGLQEYRESMRRARRSEVLNSWFSQQMAQSGLQNVVQNPQ